MIPTTSTALSICVIRILIVSMPDCICCDDVHVDMEWCQGEYLAGCRRTTYDAYSHFGAAVSIRPDLLTHQKYLERSAELAKWKRIRERINENQRRGESPPRFAHIPVEGRPAVIKSYTLDMCKDKVWECRQVTGRSELTRLPYFDIARHTLLDMMHTAAGCVSAHLMKLHKDRLAKYSETPKAIAADVLKKWDDDSKLMGRAYAKLTKRAKDVIDTNKKKFDAFHERKELHRFYCLYKRQPAQLLSAAHAYTRIQAPLGIAPASIAPFQRPGEMTAYHWINFIKVYGKYLMSRLYPAVYPLAAEPLARTYNPALKGSCMLIDLLKLCLASSVTSKIKSDTDVMARSIAGEFDRIFPATEKAIVMHNLIFHIPDTIRMWGPARGFWCFPFERYIHRHHHQSAHHTHRHHSWIASIPLCESNLNSQRGWMMMHSPRI